VPRDQRLEQRLIRPGVQVVRLPDPPRLRVRVSLIRTQPEPIDLQPLRSRIDDEAHVVAAGHPQDSAELIASLRSQPRQRVQATVVRVEELNALTPRRQPRVQASDPPLRAKGRSVNHAAPSGQYAEALPDTRVNGFFM
jgi:hypothetical protein